MTRFYGKVATVIVAISFILSGLPAMASGYTPPDNGHPHDSMGSGTR